jgi:ATP-dependent DNA helicase RecQ
MLRPYSCQLLVGAKHLEDKLSVITKNSSPNASPVQLSVVSGKTITNYQLPITNYQLPITHYQ